MTGRVCQSVRPTSPFSVAPDRSRFATPDASPPWNSPPASPRSFSTTTGPDFDLTGPACETHARHHRRLRLTPQPVGTAVQDAVSNLKAPYGAPYLPHVPESANRSDKKKPICGEFAE